MNRSVQIHEGKLIWSGEHWINALRVEGSDAPSAWISLFHTRYSPVGQGNAAHIMIPEKQIDMICTDSEVIAAWTKERFFAKSTYSAENAPAVTAQFTREGSTHRDPSWIIQTDEHRIVARWGVTEPPVIANASFRPGTEHFTILFFTDEASVEIDGQRIEGRAYPRDIWQPTIGGLRSSCVFALAETLIDIG